MYLFGNNPYAALGVDPDDLKESFKPIKLEISKINNEIPIQFSLGWKYTMILTQNGNIYSFGLHHRLDVFRVY